MPQPSSLKGRTVLIVQRRWIIARTLADAFEAKGAKVVMTKDALSELAGVSSVSAAVLDSTSGDLRQQLSARGTPFVLYTARERTDDAPIVQKPAPVADIVARLEELLI